MAGPRAGTEQRLTDSGVRRDHYSDRGILGKCPVVKEKVTLLKEGGGGGGGAKFKLMSVFFQR